MLIWADVLRLGLSFDQLIGEGLRVSDLVCMQPDPMQWIKCAGAGLAHARMMTIWPVNPFTHLGADLGDVLAQRFSADELKRMSVSHGQLVRNGMTEKIEPMFRFDAREWALLGKPASSVSGS